MTKDNILRLINAFIFSIPLLSWMEGDSVKEIRVIKVPFRIETIIDVVCDNFFRQFAPRAYTYYICNTNTAKQIIKKIATSPSYSITIIKLKNIVCLLSSFGNLHVANAHEVKHCGCNIIEVVLNDNEIRNYLSLETRIRKPVYLYNMNSYFVDCKSLTVNNNTYYIFNDENKYINDTSGSKMTLEIHRDKLDLFDIYIYDQATGINATVRVRCKGDKFFIVKKNFGYQID